MARVVAERIFPTPVDIPALKIAARDSDGCLARQNAEYLYGYLGPDLQRMICVYEAADAESVRIANRQAGMPFERVYTATVHEPPVPPSPAAAARASTDVLVERTFNAPVAFAECRRSRMRGRGVWASTA